MITSYFDGSTEPINPGGHTSYGALVKCDHVVIFSESGYVGVGAEMSNNVGEYAGCIAVLKFLLREGIETAKVSGDSKLVIKQMSGKWRAKGGLYLPYYREAIELARQLPGVRFKWIPREHNTEADYLSRQAIKTVPRSASRDAELAKLVREQRADSKTDFYSRLIKKSNYGASRATEGTPF